MITCENLKLGNITHGSIRKFQSFKAQVRYVIYRFVACRCVKIILIIEY